MGGNHAVFYRDLFPPQLLADSNNDGVGDLKGITPRSSTI